MKTIAPKGLHGAMLCDLLADLAITPKECAKYLDVTERSVFRWLADDSAPRAALLALWHITRAGLHSASIDVGNEAMHAQGLARATGAALASESARLARVLAIADTGAANDPLLNGPIGPGPGGCPSRPKKAPQDVTPRARPESDYLRLRN